MNSRLFGAVAALVVLAAGFARPQQESPPDEGLTFRVQSHLVQIYLTVTDGTRRVTDLKASDFAISEDGTPREIERLDSATVPLVVALLLDTSESMRQALPVTQETAIAFVESLRATDRVVLIPFNLDIRAVPQLTDDQTPVFNAIRSTQARGGTKLYDALLFAMKLLSGKEGRKAIVVLSDGEDTARTSSLEVTLNATARYGFPIYTIGAGSVLTRQSLQRVLRQLSDINSGKMYLVTDPRELHKAFEEVATELRSAYVLNYYTSVPHDGRWHDVKISVASNPKLKVHCRKGFYAKTGGSSSLLTELDERRKITISQEVRAGPAEEKAARRATSELLKLPAPAREIEVKPIELQARGKTTDPKTPVFKVEIRFVEVPVSIESMSDRTLLQLSERDFRVYEDDQLREIAFFSRDPSLKSLEEVRNQAMKKVRASSGEPESVTLMSESEELKLGRYYLVLDNLLSDIQSFMYSKKAAEAIFREFSSPLRPITLHFASDSSANIMEQDDIERLIERIQKAVPHASRELTGNDGVMTIYEAYLIERGDREATELAELRYAASVSAQYKNGLGEVDGQTGFSPEEIRNAVINTAHQLLAENFAQVARTIDGLRAVVHAASADPGSYPKDVIFISTGFCLGRGSERADLAVLFENLLSDAKRNKVRMHTIDASGLAVDEPIGIGANAGFLMRNPHLISILNNHVRAWRMDRQSQLSQIATEAGGRFLHSTNDLLAAAGTLMRRRSQLYYLGYLSRQAADGRYHRIRVAVSKPGLQVHARRGYFAGRRNEPETVAVTAPSGEGWDVLVAKANKALKAGDHKELVAALEQLVRRFPNQPDFWYNLGAAHFNLGNPQRAVEALQRAFALVPEDRNVGLTLSRAFVAAGYRAAASETLEMMLRRQPRDIDLLMNLGRIYEADSRASDAYEIYRRVLDLELAPPVELYVLLTRTSTRLGRRLEADLFIQDYLARGGTAALVEEWRKQ